MTDAAPAQQQPDEVRWWVCPNTPPCPHGAVLHDTDDPHEGPFTCCAEGCACGHPAAPSAQPDEPWSTTYARGLVRGLAAGLDLDAPLLSAPSTPAQPVRDTEEGRR